jgi:hypothetical protein
MPTVPKRPLTPDEALAIKALCGVRFPVASWDKRFYRDVLAHARETHLIGEKSVPQLREFLQQGGTVVAIGSSSNLAYQLKLPLRSALTEAGQDGKPRPRSDDNFYIPGSVLSARIAQHENLAWGMPETADVFFERSAVFKFEEGAEAAGLKAIAWYDSATPLRSGWGWGQKHLKGGVAVAQAKVGDGTLYLFGSEVAFRGQTHGTYKLLFNALQLSGTAGESKNRAP